MPQTGGVRSRWEGKVAIITGASSGIGAATAVRLAGLGAEVVGVARRADRREDTMAACRRHRPASFGHVADVSSRSECEAVAAAVLDRCQRIDVLVNNAGISLHCGAADTTVEDIERVMAVNYFGAVYLTMAALRGKLYPPSVVADGVVRMVERRLTHLTVPRQFGAVGALYPLVGRPMRWGIRRYAGGG